MNVKVLVAVSLLMVAVAIGVTSFRKTMTPYITFAEARQSSGLVQVHGVLADKQYVLQQDRQYMSFRLKDEQGEVLPVEYQGVIPGNFDQATSIVAIGRYHNFIKEKDKENIRYKEANVVSVSDDIKCIKQADVIYYDKAAGHGIEFEGNDYQVIRLQDVVIVL